MVGGVGGAVVKHPLIGAAAGCAVGHHEAKKKSERERDEARQRQQQAASAPASR